MPVVCLARRSSVRQIQPTQRTPLLSVAVEEAWQKADFSLEKPFFFADFLPTSGYFPGLCVSPAVGNALRLSSTPQFRSANTTDPTHAPTFRRSRGTWQKADFSLEKSRFLATE